MLGKLLKYDLWDVSKVLLPVHIGVIILTLIETLILTLKEMTEYLSATVIILMTGAYSIYLIAAAALTVIFIVYHFYKSLYSDRGYLTFTLPVKTTTLLISKTLTALIWGLINAIVTGGCIFLIFYLTSDLLRDFWKTVLQFREHSELFNIFFWAQIPILPILFLIALFLTYSRFYMCFTLGQMFGSHRFAFGLLTWFGLNIIRQVVSFIGEIVLFSTVPGHAWLMRVTCITSIEDLTRFFYGLELLSAIFMLLFGAIYWIIAAKLMKNKLNLA
jgi:hypothetical protein